MDLGRSFLTSVLRQPGAEAVVDGSVRRTYAQWYEEIRAAAGGLKAMGLKQGDHFVVVMRNRYEMATLYWASHMPLVRDPGDARRHQRQSDCEPAALQRERECQRQPRDGSRRENRAGFR